MSNARNRHESLLVQLHQEMKEGRGDGDRANAIGDEMTELWAKLDAEERELFDELSEDLYLIEGKRLVTPLHEGETVESVRKEMAIAIEEQRDRDALALARKLEDVGPKLTYVIGQCWERLGFRLGAKCFHDFAQVCVDAYVGLTMLHEQEAAPQIRALEQYKFEKARDILRKSARPRVEAKAA